MNAITEHQIYSAAQYYLDGLTDKFALAAKMKVHERTLRTWKNTDLWQGLVGKTDFRIPCRRKNLIAFNNLQKRYFEMTNISECNRLSILERDPKCNVSRCTLNTWRTIWRRTNLAVL